MLVKLTDVKGEAVWINPTFVRALRDKKGVTEVYVVPGVGAQTGVIKVKQPLDDVAMTLNVGLLGEDALGPQSNQDATMDPGMQVAINAATMG